MSWTNVCGQQQTSIVECFLLEVAPSNTGSGWNWSLWMQIKGHRSRFLRCGVVDTEVEAKNEVMVALYKERKLLKMKEGR